MAASGRASGSRSSRGNVTCSEQDAGRRGSTSSLAALQERAETRASQASRNVERQRSLEGVRRASDEPGSSSLSSAPSTPNRSTAKRVAIMPTGHLSAGGQSASSESAITDERKAQLKKLFRAKTLGFASIAKTLGSAAPELDCWIPQDADVQRSATLKRIAESGWFVARDYPILAGVLKLHPLFGSQETYNVAAALRHGKVVRYLGTGQPIWSPSAEEKAEKIDQIFLVLSGCAAVSFLETRKNTLKKKGSRNFGKSSSQVLAEPAEPSHGDFKSEGKTSSPLDEPHPGMSDFLGGMSANLGDSRKSVGWLERIELNRAASGGNIQRRTVRNAVVAQQKTERVEYKAPGALFGGDARLCAGVSVADGSELVALVLPLQTAESELRAASDLWERGLSLLRRNACLAEWAEVEFLSACEFLSQLPVFEDQSQEALHRLVHVVRYRRCKQGEVLIQQGSKHESLFLVLSGKVGIFRKEGASGAGSTPLSVAATNNASRRVTLDSCRAQTEDLQNPSSNGGLGRRMQVIGCFEVVDDCALCEKFSETAARCEEGAEVLVLPAKAYEFVVGKEGLERHQQCHILRSVPPNIPGEPVVRSMGELVLLSKAVLGNDQFKQLNRDIMLQSMGTATYLSVPVGHIVFREGAPGDKFYAILEGKCGVFISADGGRRSSKNRIAFSLIATRSSFADNIVVHRSPRPDSSGQAAVVAAAVGAAKEGSVRFAESRANSPDTAGHGTTGVAEPGFTGSEPDTQGSSSTSRLAPLLLIARKLKSGHFARTQAQSAIPSRGRPQIPTDAATGSQRCSADPDTGFRSSSPSPSRQPGSQMKPETSGSLRAPSPAQAADSAIDEQQLTRGDSADSFGDEESQVNADEDEAEEDLGKQVATLTSGDSFGERTLMKKEPRTASVKALEPTKFLVLTQESYVTVLKTQLEADLTERISFLDTHLPGLRKNGAELDRSETRRIERVAALMFAHRHPRGKILIHQGDYSNSNIYFLKAGSWSIREPRKTQSKFIGRSLLAPELTKVVSYVSKPGQMCGTTTAVLSEKEPCDIVIESAYVDTYCLAWPVCVRQWSGCLQRVLDAIQNLSVDSNMRLADGCAPAPRSLAVEEKIYSVESVKAWQGFFDVALGVQGLADDATREVLEQRGRITPGTTCHSHPESVGVSINKLEDTILAAEKGRHIAVKEIPRSPRTVPRHPPDLSNEGLRAEFYHLLAQDPTDTAKLLLKKAVQDPRKGDFASWVRRYMQHPQLANNQCAQDFLRKHTMPRKRIGSADGPAIRVHYGVGEARSIPVAPPSGHGGASAGYRRPKSANVRSHVGVTGGSAPMVHCESNDFVARLGLPQQMSAAGSALFLSSTALPHGMAPRGGRLR